MNAPYKRLDVTLDMRVGKNPEKPENTQAINSSEMVYEITKEYAEADREIILLVMVDCKNNLVNLETHTIGGVDCLMVYPREVFRSLLLKGATSFMLVHNHPAGDAEPSFADRELTNTLKEGSELIGIKMLDHIVLGKGRYYSFADKGEL